MKLDKKIEIIKESYRLYRQSLEFVVINYSNMLAARPYKKLLEKYTIFEEFEDN